MRRAPASPSDPQVKEREIPPVSIGFLAGTIAMLLGTALLIVWIVVVADNGANNAAAVVGAVLSPVTAVVGAILGHHVGARQR